MNARARALFYDPDEQHVGGVLLAPSVKILCAYPEDGNSMALTKVCTPPGGDGATCIPGCSPVGWQCQDVGALYSTQGPCSFPPERLEEALAGQVTLHDTHGGVWRNNEVVIDMAHYARTLPMGVDGLYYMAGSPEEGKARIRAIHRSFITQYRFPLLHAPPLLELDLEHGGDHPFRLVPDDRQWSAGAGR